MSKLFDAVGADRMVLVWSMWRGYWERQERGIREWATGHAAAVHFVHSGGHAWPEDLARLKAAIGARETIPVHTEWRGEEAAVL